MIYSKTCEYAIRSLVYFTRYEGKAFVTAREVSRSTKVPPAYVAKIFQCLAKSGILGSVRGPKGGYSLLVPPARLSILKVMPAVDDSAKSPFSNCVMGLRRCSDRNPCPLHECWTRAKDRMLQTLATSTILDVAGLVTILKQANSAVSRSQNG